MNIRSKLVLSVAAMALTGGLSAMAQAADQVAQVTTLPTASAPSKPVADVQNPKQTLVGAKVKDSKGEAVGEVKSVKLGTDGKIASVNVSFGSRTIALKADGLSYAQADNTVTSPQSKDEISKVN